MSTRIFLCLLFAVFLPSLWAAPPAPRLTSPGTVNSPGTTVASLTPTFIWQPATTATRYSLSIYASGGGQVYSVTPAGAGLSHVLPSGVLLGSGSYYWVVRAGDSAGSWSANSTPFYFKAPGGATSAPSAPVPTSPGTASQPGVEITTQTPTFDWAPSAGASVYSLQLFRTDGGLVYSSGNIPSSSTQYLSPQALTGGVSYYWQVQAINGIGASNWSARRYFTVPVPPPPAPSLFSPGSSFAPGAVLTGSNVTFSWSGSGISYEVAVYSADGQTTHWGTPQVVNQSVTIPVSTLPAGSALSWRVRARSGTTANTVGPWSSYYYFQTAVPPPAPVTGDLAGPGPVLATRASQLSWDTGGATYDSVSVSIAMQTSPFTVISLSGLTGTSVTLPAGIAACSSWAWTVQGVVGGNMSVVSAPRYFRTGCPPAAPATVSPGQIPVATGLTPGLTPQFSWTAIADATSYRVRVFSGAVTVWDSAAPGTSITIPAGLLGVGQTYRWSVSGENSWGSSAESTRREFRTAWRYADWMQAAGFSPDQAGYRPGDSPAGGAPNLLRYAFGGSAGSPTPPAPELISVGAARKLRIPLKTDAGDVSVLVEASENGTSWTTIAANVTTAGDVELGPVWSAKPRAIFRAQVSLVP